MSLPITPMMVLFLIGLGGYLGCDPNTLQAPPDMTGEGAEQGAPPSGYPTSASVNTNRTRVRHPCPSGRQKTPSSWAALICSG